MSPRPLLEEPLGLVAPLALRFWDAVTDAPVGEGLVVWAHPSGMPWRRVRGLANRSGVYVFHDLPDIRQLEFGAGDEDYWSHLSAPRSYVVEVEDADHRFQPLRLEAKAPWRGLFPSCDLASPPGVPRVPLFSAPNRPVPGAFAVVRAELREAETGRPAAWALTEVDVPGRNDPERGLADREGRVAVIFPYPEPDGAISGSPPSSSSLFDQAWTLPVRAFYTPEDPPADVPELCATLLAQNAAVLWEQDPPTGSALTSAVVRFGRETVLRSRKTADGSSLPYLLITGGGSPP